jgi:HD-GYP domain-containing protein (c-di-GMP phosphodiesterase class II)
VPVAGPPSSVPAEGAAGDDAGHPGPVALLSELESAVTGFLEAARAGDALPLSALEGLASRLVDALAAGDDLVIRALDGGQGQESLAAHCVHVAIFAVRIAAGMGLDRSEQEQVALAALVHDVGMARLLPDLTHPTRILMAPEQRELERHPEEGFKVLSALGPAYTWLADVAHQEHEREDGSGYPRGLVGGAIGEIARIVALADIYESLTHARPHQRTLVPFDAVREILASQRGRFSERALRGLMTGLSAFPVGSLVRLSTREVARVVAGNPDSPLRPVVEVLLNAAGGRTEGRRIDLAKSALLHIVDAATVQELL